MRSTTGLRSGLTPSIKGLEYLLISGYARRRSIDCREGAQKHLIPGSGICSNQHLRINHLRSAEWQGFWASVSVQAAGVQSGTEVKPQPVSFRHSTNTAEPPSAPGRPITVENWVGRPGWRYCFPGSGPTRTSSFPKFCPLNNPWKAATAFSSPSTTSSRYLTLPSRSH